MAMVVEITNITDASEKHPPTQVSIYTQKLDPGEVLKLPAGLVDERLKKLELGGWIAIGQVPSWYEASKARRAGRPHMTPEQTALAKKPTRRKREAPPVAAEVTEKPGLVETPLRKKSKGDDEEKKSEKK